MCLSRVNQEMQILYTPLSICFVSSRCFVFWTGFVSLEDMLHSRRWQSWPLILRLRTRELIFCGELCILHVSHRLVILSLSAKLFTLISVSFPSFWQEVRCLNHSAPTFPFIVLLRMQPLLPMSMPFAYAKLCSFWQEV